MEDLLRAHYFDVIKQTGKTAFLCRRHGDTVMVKTNVTAESMRRLRICDEIRFLSMVIPRYEFIAVSEDDFICVMPNLGETLPWSERDESDLQGGKNLDVEKLFHDCIEIFENLLIISVQTLDLPKTGMELNKKAQNGIKGLAAKGYITKTEVFSLLQRIALVSNEPLILSNGDFYPRNMISARYGQPSLALIDWDEAGIEPAPWVFSWMYVHMWGLPEFQAAWRQNGVERYGEQAISDGIIVTSARLAGLWVIDRECHHRNALASMVHILRQEMEL